MFGPFNSVTVTYMVIQDFPFGLNRSCAIYVKFLTGPFRDLGPMFVFCIAFDAVTNGNHNIFDGHAVFIYVC